MPKFTSYADLPGARPVGSAGGVLDATVGSTPMPPDVDPTRPLAISAGLLGLAPVTNYVVLVSAEEDGLTSQVILWAVVMAVPSLLALASTLVPPAPAFWGLLLATVLFLPMVALAPFGMVGLLGALLTVVAAIRTREGVAGAH